MKAEKLHWTKEGRIFDPETHPNWKYQYSQVPWAIELNGNIKVYFTARPEIEKNGQFVSYTFFADFQKDDFSRLLKVSPSPILELGELGTFDEFGTMPCSVVKRDDLGEVWLYYVGWNRKASVPYDCAIGLAISRDNGETFQKYSKGPILGQSATNPFLLGCPRVYNFRNLWHMWYLAATEWIYVDGRTEAIYHLKLAVSTDGINWTLRAENVIPKKYSQECQTCASVFEHNGYYHMYFTYRYGLDFRNPERGYRIGYAYSENLITWERNDELGGIDLSASGWDSEMICYPSVTEINGKKMMLHCGNYFGKTGFGYAILN